MKLTNKQLLSSVPSLNHLNTLKLPVKASFRVAKAARSVDESLQDYRKTLEKLQEKHAEKDEDGKMKTDENRVVFKDESAFQIEFEELLDMESELSVKKISLDDLGSVEVEPSFLYHLDWFIED